MARRCTGTTKKGKPCKAAPLRDSDTCLSHADAETRESVGFVADNGKGGRPRVPRATEIARRLVEEHAVEVVRPYFRALGIDLVRQEDGTVLVEPCAGPVKYVWAGSDEPAVPVLDLGAQIDAAEKLQNRLHGKPRQAVEVSGAGGGPISHEVDVDIADPIVRKHLDAALERAAELERIGRPLRGER